jgi:hypothetical protein
MDVYLYQGEVNPYEIVLSNPLNLRGLALSKLLDDSISSSDELNRDSVINLADTLTHLDDIYKRFESIYADSSTITDLRSIPFDLTFDEIVAFADLFKKDVEISRTDTANITESFSKVRQAFIELVDAIILSDVYARDVEIRRSDSSTLSESKIKALSFPLADSISVTELISKKPSLVKADAISTSEGITSKNIGVVVDEIVAFSEELAKRYEKTLSEFANIQDLRLIFVDRTVVLVVNAIQKGLSMLQMYRKKSFTSTRISFEITTMAKTRKRLIITETRSKQCYINATLT